ncbi:CBY1-interacting BAR domain-containing protein 1 isoform X2 [Boleophthalmus pectinirostris]|uniref:CBY1-interacting BAR domain-containing protein 1 isoform X2 n=1 Tax=Boleophthalmus pectinirostris TaxID=150288 RepID=UPI00242B59A6|nr:CBY1-interacting BAR domain-containing protein 1 isoform X2 [Boleophthalmus pectinirostris]
MSFIGQYADTETPDLKGASSSLQITWLRRKTIPMVESGALQRQRLQRVTMDVTRITRSLKETIDDSKNRKSEILRRSLGSLWLSRCCLMLKPSSCTLWPTRVFRAWMRRRTWRCSGPPCSQKNSSPT